MAIRLAKRKKSVFATDLSTDMLEVAKQKAMAENVNLILQRIDTVSYTHLV